MSDLLQPLFKGRFCKELRSAVMAICVSTGGCAHRARQTERKQGFYMYILSQNKERGMMVMDA